MKYLTHCTSYINALHILLEKKAVFGNMRSSNDRTEADLLGEDRVTLYSFCLFSDSYENIGSLMWLAYSGRTNGASITFCFDNETEFKDLFYGDKEISDFLMEYSEDDLEIIGDDLSKIGHLKNIKFKDEKEYRFMIERGWIDEIGFERKPINFDCLKKIILCVDPHLFELSKIIFKDNSLIEIQEMDYLQ